ncbi:MAG: GNAT family N-acetyltransferase [Bacteroidaceae bacterium]|jgi:hypothetical protein
MEEIIVVVADASHEKYVDTILETITVAAKVRGTGIAKRSHEYVATKMREGKAVIALCGEEFAGFSYIETWGNKHYVTTSGLIVSPNYRNMGVAKHIKDMTFTLARTRWPKAKIFSLTSGSAVMKMNTNLGYMPVTFSDLTDDEAFWRGCEGCVNVDVLKRTERRYCICTGMLFNPEDHPNEPLPAELPQNVKDRLKKIDI